MGRGILIALLLCFSCGPGKDVGRPPSPVPPPPPPLPIDREGDGPGDVPPAIAAFLAGGKDVQVVLYRFSDAYAPGAGSFQGSGVAERHQLPDALAARTVAAFEDRRNWTDNHVLCTDPGFGIRMVRGDARLDLIVGLSCRHVHDAASGEEIGFLSIPGQEHFAQLAREVHEQPPSS